MKKENYCINLDQRTINLLDRYAKDHSISRSAGVRLIINEFFLRKANEKVPPA